MTEGIGCYDYNINPNRIDYGRLTDEQRELTCYRFHQNGWPNRIGKLCNFDKVLNLGSAASSNSIHLKLFVDKVLPQINELKLEYDLYLIWMLTEYTRFSFYTDKEIKKFMPSGRRFNFDNMEMENAYVKALEEFTIGPLRETIFLLKLSESLFKEHGINTIYTHWSKTHGDVDLEDMYYSPSLLTASKSFNLLEGITNNKDLTSEVKDDSHPNEKGYQEIARRIFEEIKKNHKHFITNKPVSEFEWEWDGDCTYTHNLEFFTKIT